MKFPSYHNKVMTGGKKHRKTARRGKTARKSMKGKKGKRCKTMKKRCRK